MYKKIEKDFPIKLKMLRLDLGLSQEEFSQKIGISRSCLANYETGKRQPDREMICRIAQICNVSTEILTDKNSENRTRLNENNQNFKNQIKSMIQNKGNAIDISHFPAEHKISMFEFYDFICSIYRKKNNYMLG